MSQPSILIVDDEPSNFDVIEARLSDRNYQLHYAASGAEAIATLDAFNPDLILLDVMMPGIDGIEVCRQVKAMSKWQATPIIMVTALNSKSDLANCLTAGADDFISKPVNGVELRARVQSMLRIKQQYDSIQAFSHVQANTINVLESALDELCGNLAKRVSHELNTPLNGILGTLELLQGNLDTMERGEIREMLGWAEESAHRLEDLTQKLRTYLELELHDKQHQPPDSVQTRFSPAAIETLLKARAQRWDRGDDLSVALEEAVIALPSRSLSMLLYELLDNALKFSPPGTVIKVTSQVAGESLIVSIHDAGQGMTAEQIARIGALMQFERHKYEQQGLGLGLTIVKKIVDLVGGAFSVTSVYQQETTVQLTLPLVR